MLSRVCGAARADWRPGTPALTRAQCIHDDGERSDAKAQQIREVSPSRRPDSNRGPLHYE